MSYLCHTGQLSYHTIRAQFYAWKSLKIFSIFLLSESLKNFWKNEPYTKSIGQKVASVLSFEVSKQILKYFCFLIWISRVSKIHFFSKFIWKLQMKPQKRVFVLWTSYRAHFFRNFLNFTKIKESKIFSMFFMHKIEHEWYDKIIGRYDINMTYFAFIMSYRDFEHLVKVSQNL